jgi:NAD(P)-dependent dehydrogenase (short-subunit alcohol dehydrogenase family)
MPDSEPRSLTGRIAVVTGASRGAGSAIAVELGRHGATVYVTGRSTRAAGATENLPGTIDDTAAGVSAAGGEGIAVRVDHTVDAQAAELFDRVKAEQGGLDLLVNNAWGGYEHHDMATFTAPLWDQPLERWNQMFTAGVRATLVSSRFAAPLMLGRPSALIISTVAWAFGGFLGSVPYDTAKAAIIRMMFGMAQELRPHGVAALALAPGFMRTERVMKAHAEQPVDLSPTESPAYLARAVAALAADPRVIEKTGQVLTVGDLARQYGFTDADGRQPPPFRLPPA